MTRLKSPPNPSLERASGAAAHRRHRELIVARVNRVGGSSRRVGAVLLFVLAAVLMAVGVMESWSVVTRPDPARVAEYHFGSEAMIAHGGWQYSNPEVYGWTSLLLVAGIAVPCALLGVAVWRRSTGLGLLAAFLIVAASCCWYSMAHMEWERRGALRVDSVSLDGGKQLNHRCTGRREPEAARLTQVVDVGFARNCEGFSASGAGDLMSRSAARFPVAREP